MDEARSYKVLNVLFSFLKMRGHPVLALGPLGPVIE